MYNEHCILQCTLDNVQCTMNPENDHCKMFTVQCTLYNELYIVHY